MAYSYSISLGSQAGPLRNVERVYEDSEKSELRNVSVSGSDEQETPSSDCKESEVKVKDCREEINVGYLQIGSNTGVIEEQ